MVSPSWSNCLWVFLERTVQWVLLVKVPSLQVTHRCFSKHKWVSTLILGAMPSRSPSSPGVSAGLQGQRSKVGSKSCTVGKSEPPILWQEESEWGRGWRWGSTRLCPSKVTSSHQSWKSGLGHQRQWGWSVQRGGENSRREEEEGRAESLCLLASEARSLAPPWQPSAAQVILYFSGGDAQDNWMVA